MGVCQGVDHGVGRAHDVGGDDGLVVLAAGDLAEVEQVTDDSDQKAVLLLLHHAAADAADCPAQCVERAPAPLLAIQLHAAAEQHFRFLLKGRKRMVRQKQSRPFRTPGM